MIPSFVRTGFHVAYKRTVAAVPIVRRILHLHCVPIETNPAMGVGGEVTLRSPAMRIGLAHGIV